MAGYKSAGTKHGELMAFLMNERPRFATEEEFKAFALDEVRHFINDLRSINIELTLRPTYFGTTLPHHSVAESSAE
jgi:hypothetical protein